MILIPHLETNVTAACQNRCVSCNHFVPLQVDSFRASMADPMVIDRDLSHLSRVLHTPRYGMLGGEPLLHPGLVDILKVARASGIADIIEVWTNGQAAEKMPPAFWRAFDVLVVSAYPGKIDDIDLEWIAAKCAAEGVQFELKDERKAPNFTQLLKTREDAPQRTFERCWFKGYSRVVDNGFFYRCCTSPYIPKLLLGRPEGTDGIAVAGLTEDALAFFLARGEAMESCGICAGRNTPEAVPVAWREVADPAEWLAASSGGR